MLCKIGYRILQSNNSRTFKNDPIRTETRELKQIITSLQIREMEKFLKNKRLEGRGLT